VTFRDEPGEGSGVARSFYTAFCQAILSAEKLPNLEPALVGSKSLQYSKTVVHVTVNVMRCAIASLRNSSSAAAGHPVIETFSI